MIQVYKTDGSISEYKPKKKYISLEEMQSIVGGYIETVTLKDKIIVCNEEGKLMNLPHNEKMTEIFQETCGTHDCIVGDAIFMDRKEMR